MLVVGFTQLVPNSGCTEVRPLLPYQSGTQPGSAMSHLSALALAGSSMKG